MSQYLPALDYLIEIEDPLRKYEEVIDNNGGRVIAGINSRSFPAQEGFIASLPVDQRPSAVASFYQMNFWNPMQLGGIISQDLANRVLDMGVNAGIRPAIRLLQEAVNLIRPGSLEEDGAIGPLTLYAANTEQEEAILAAFRSARLGYYQAIVAKNPDDAVYLGTATKPGTWWRRAIA